MLNTEMEHGKLEEQGRLLPDRKRQEDHEKLHKGFGVKQFPTASAERAREYLKQIPADCDYDTWFKAGCALKHEGLPYEVFRDWSATAPGKFDENECRRQWENISDEKENLISLGTLKWLARQNGSPLFEMLSPP